MPFPDSDSESETFRLTRSKNGMNNEPAANKDSGGSGEGGEGGDEEASATPPVGFVGKRKMSIPLANRAMQQHEKEVHEALADDVAALRHTATKHLEKKDFAKEVRGVKDVDNFLEYSQVRERVECQSYASYSAIDLARHTRRSPGDDRGQASGLHDGRHRQQGDRHHGRDQVLDL